MQDWTRIDVGQYTAGFGAVEGYSKPADQQVEVTAGQTTHVMGTYQEIQSFSERPAPSTPCFASMGPVALPIALLCWMAMSRQRRQRGDR